MRLLAASLLLLLHHASPQPQPGWAVPLAETLSGEAKQLLDQAAVAYKVKAVCYYSRSYHALMP